MKLSEIFWFFEHNSERSVFLMVIQIVPVFKFSSNCIRHINYLLLFQKKNIIYKNFKKKINMVRIFALISQ